MSRLYLLRHAKAGWALPGVRDFDRPLDASGRRRRRSDRRGHARPRLCSRHHALLQRQAGRARRWKASPATPTPAGCCSSTRSTARMPPAISRIIRENGGPRLAAGHRPQPDDGGSCHGGLGRRRRGGAGDAESRVSDLRAWRSSAFPAALPKPRPAPAISKPSSRPPISEHAADAISKPRRQRLYRTPPSPREQHFGIIADHLHRRGEDCARHAVGPRRRAVFAVAAARRHRPVARRQDGVHLGAASTI